MSGNRWQWRPDHLQKLCMLSKAAARTQEAVCEAIGALLDRFTTEECANYFKNSGYGST